MLNVRCAARRAERLDAEDGVEPLENLQPAAHRAVADLEVLAQRVHRQRRAHEITEAFFRAVREVNASLPPERRLRVLLGGPPIDWDAVESREDHQKWIELRDTHAATLIRREVIEKGRRALVVYGSMHLQRRNLFSNYELVEDPNLHTLVQQLEREGGARVFTVWPTAWPTAGVDLQEAQPDVASWRAPSLAPVRGTVLGAADFSAFYPAEVPRATIRDGRIVTSRDGRIVPVPP